MIDKERLEELRGKQSYLDDDYLTIDDLLDTIEALLRVKEAAEVHNKHCSEIINGDLYMALKACELSDEAKADIKKFHKGDQK